MSVEKVTQFLMKVGSDSGLRTEFEALPAEGWAAAVTTMAARHGFEFSIDDLASFYASQNDGGADEDMELSDDMLDAVAGGFEPLPPPPGVAPRGPASVGHR